MGMAGADPDMLGLRPTVTISPGRSVLLRDAEQRGFALQMRMLKTQARRIRTLDFTPRSSFSRADEACDKGIGWTVVKFCREPICSTRPARRTNDTVCKSHRLYLVVCVHRPSWRRDCGEAWQFRRASGFATPHRGWTAARRIERFLDCVHRAANGDAWRWPHGTRRGVCVREAARSEGCGRHRRRFVVDLLFGQLSACADQTMLSNTLICG